MCFPQWVKQLLLPQFKKQIEVVKSLALQLDGPEFKSCGSTSNPSQLLPSDPGLVREFFSTQSDGLVLRECQRLPAISDLNYSSGKKPAGSFSFLQEQDVLNGSFTESWNIKHVAISQDGKDKWNYLFAFQWTFAIL